MSSVIRIKEVFASNFKGFAGDIRIPFHPNPNGTLFLLGGPNGYGKTTVFDILEICIRGELKRAVETFGNVERVNADFGKMPFQNLTNVDVFFSVLLEEEFDGETKYRIILRHYPGDSEGRIGKERRNKAASFFGPLMGVYYSEDLSVFASKELSNYELSSETEIADKLKDCLYSGKTSAADAYLLLNYVQQQDNIHYLTKSERDKSAAIAFLFQTTEKELEEKKLKEARDLSNELLKKLTPAIKDLKQRLKSPLPSKATTFDQFLPDKGDLRWDMASPFDGVLIGNLKNEYEGIVSKLKELEDFVQSFDPDEYEKEQLRQSLSKVSALEIKSFLCSKLLAPDQLRYFKQAYEKREGLRKIFAMLEIKEESDGPKGYPILDVELLYVNPDFRSILAKVGFEPEQIKFFDDLVNDFKGLNKRMGDAARLSKALTEAKRKMFVDLKDLHKLHPLDGTCPLCGWDYTSFDILTGAIDKQIQETKSEGKGLNADKAVTMNQLSTTYLEPTILKICEQFQEAGLARLEGIYSELRQLSLNPLRFTDLSNLFSQVKIPFTVHELSDILTDEMIRNESNGVKERIGLLIDSLVVDSAKVANDHYYASLFDRDKVAFGSITVDRLLEKRLFVDQQYRNASSTMLAVLEARIEKVSQLYDRLKRSADSMGKGIKSYKQSLVNMLKIPMYVYSAKILQNCPQGDGIFLSMSNSDTVTFEIDNYSSQPPNGDKHDIVHHLSTGQMAVVSIAFCLALNRLSKTPFKFIAIDDPLQTLDDLNIHSFIELVRHDFQKYQLLFSTHEDHAARYLLYRFYKAGFKVEYMDVKKAFLAPSAL